MKADLADLNAFLTVAQARGFRNAARGRIERLDAQRSGTAVRCRRSAPLRRPPRTAPWLSSSGAGQERGTRVARTYPAPPGPARCSADAVRGSKIFPSIQATIHPPDGSLTRSSCRMSFRASGEDRTAQPQILLLQPSSGEPDPSLARHTPCATGNISWRSLRSVGKPRWSCRPDPA